MNDDPPEAYSNARVLVRRLRRPLGFVVVPLSSEGVTDSLRGSVAALLDGIGTRALDGGPVDTTHRFTIAVCTRDRPRALARCLRSVQDLAYDNFDVLVVDNAPSDSATRALVEEITLLDPRVRYVLEPRPGLSNARNRALEEAHSECVAFTDDDVVVDRWWLHGLARGFQSGAGVACVTGLVPVARLASAAERYFDARVSWSDRLDPVLFDLDGYRQAGLLFPYQAGAFGTGANFAVDRDHLLAIGGFDPNLGAGSPTSGGEDLDAFVRVIRSSRMLAYEPSAIVWHFHREDIAGLESQMRDYGRGLAAVITKWLTQSGTREEVLRRVPLALAHLWRLWRHSAAQPAIGSTKAFRFTLAEIAGALSGPACYYRSLRAHRGRPSAPPWR